MTLWQASASAATPPNRHAPPDISGHYTRQRGFPAQALSPMLFDEVARTSLHVAETSARLQKVAALAACLERMQPDEAPIGICFLSGELRQGRIGIGWAAVRDAAAEPAAQPGLELREVDAAFTRIAGVSGSGSAAERARLMHELFSRATGV